MYLLCLDLFAPGCKVALWLEKFENFLFFRNISKCHTFSFYFSFSSKFSKIFVFFFFNFRTWFFKTYSSYFQLINNYFFIISFTLGNSSQNYVFFYFSTLEPVFFFRWGFSSALLPLYILQNFCALVKIPFAPTEKNPRYVVPAD